MSITLEDVLAFIATASSSDLNDMADEMQEQGYEFECLECETHECEESECNHDEEMHEMRDGFIKELASRGNQFGLSDMLEEFQREANRIGVHLDIRGAA